MDSRNNKVFLLDLTFYAIVLILEVQRGSQ